MMQLRLVILLLWFGYLDNDVGYIENWNIIYLKVFLLQSCVGNLGAKFNSWNLTSRPLKWPYIENVFLAAILPKQEFIFDYVPQICNQFFTTAASFSLTVILFLHLQLLCYSPCQEVLTYHIRWSTYLLLGTLYQDRDLDLCRLELTKSLL